MTYREREPSRRILFEELWAVITNLTLSMAGGMLCYDGSWLFGALCFGVYILR